MHIALQGEDGSSILQDIFQGQLESWLICQRRGETRCSKDSFWVLLLCVEKEQTTVEEVYNNFCELELGRTHY